MRARHWLLAAILLHGSLLPAFAEGIPKESVHWTVALRRSDDPQGKKGGIVEATLSCLSGRCSLSEIVVTECSGNPSGFYIFTYRATDDEADGSKFQGFESQDRRSGFITAEIGGSTLERSTYRFDYRKDGSGALRLTGVSRADLRAKSRVTGRIETEEWVPLSGALTVFNPGCGFKTFGIENPEGKQDSRRRGGHDAS